MYGFHDSVANIAYTPGVCTKRAHVKSVNMHRGEVPIMSIVWEVWEHCPVSVNSMSMTTEPNKIYICMIFLSKYIFSPF